MAVDPSERHRAALRRNADNAARLAFADFHFKVDDALGLVAFPKPGDFGLSFAERPAVSGGVFLDIDELARVLELDDGDDIGLQAPTITPMVTEWDRSEAGHYVGAWCAVNVLWPADVLEAPEGFSFYVDFTFHGIAIKDVDPEVRS